MEARVVALADILRLNTKLFRNCLDGMTDEQAHARPSGQTNNAAFVAAHLVESRFYMLRVLGAEQPDPMAPYLEGAKGIEGIQRWPTLAETQSAWTSAGHALRDRLDRLTAAELDAVSTVRGPVAGQTVIGLLAFLIQHDSYHVGQLALLRKHAGLPAMRYD